MTEALPELTDRQRQVYEFIEARIEEWGYPLTIREIGEHLGIKSTNGVADHLKALKRKGYLQQRDQKSRTLAPTTEASKKRGPRPSPHAKKSGKPSAAVRLMVPGNSQGVEIPVLGRVAAGEPILAEENAEATVVIDSFFLGGNPSHKVFALKVVGDSMIEDGIFDGDYIFVSKKPHAEPGEIVVVLIESEATVKRFYPEGDRIRLQPANSTMEPIYVAKADFKEVSIIGHVVGVYRNCAT